jgi:hypothetical protein
MSKQSSVQWLFQQLWDTPKDKFEWQSIFLMAHQMHQEEITDAYIDGHSTWGENTNAEQYYNETFNK